MIKSILNFLRDLFSETEDYDEPDPGYCPFCGEFDWDNSCQNPGCYE